MLKFLIRKTYQYLMINLFFLKTFITLARTKSFRETARLNSISQSAISQQIKSLEGKIGCCLVERSSNKVNLTPSGEVFAGYAENILDLYDDALLNVRNQVNTISGLIKVATIYSIGLYRLQPIIRTFLRKYPNVSVQLEYYHNTAIYERITNWDFDFGFVAFPKKSEGLDVRLFAEDPLVLIQSSQRPLFKKSKINFKELSGCKYVGLSQTTPTGRYLACLFRKRGIQLDVVHEFDNVETLKSAVLVGMGCAIVPKNVLVNELNKKTLNCIQISDLPMQRSLGILSPKVRVLTKAKQKFLDVLTSRTA